MKSFLGILLLSALLCACSHRRTAYIDRTIDIVAGKDIAIENFVLHIEKRSGNSLVGIRIVKRESDGKETTITAATGTLRQGPKHMVDLSPTNAAAQSKWRLVVIENPVKLTLFNAHIQTKKHSATTNLIVRTMALDF